jgi:dephospho-CoA kinase
MRIDLDELSRDVCEPGSDVLPAIADEFGADVLDPVTGELDRALLASRAFADPRRARRLEEIELPAILGRLSAQLTQSPCGQEPAVCVVEVPLLDRMGATLALADEVMCVTCPLDLRRARALARGVSEPDFDLRVSLQPTEDYLLEHADTTLFNAGSASDLEDACDAWWRAREETGWKSLRQATHR